MARRSIYVALVLLCLIRYASAQTPLGTAFTYQGQLKSGGSPAGPTANLAFSLWDAAGSGSPPVGGNQVGTTISMTNVPLTNGLFTVQLTVSGEFGAGAFNGEARWLQIAVNGTTLSPRQPLTAAPYALNVRAPLILSSNQPASDVIKGTNTASADGSVAVRGEATAATGQNYGLLGVANSSSGYGVFGFNNNGTGIRGQSADGVGIGIYGYATRNDQTNFGVYGQTESPLGFGGYFVGRGYFSGNVGIGTNNPGSSLDIAGTARMTGFQLTTGAAAGSVLTADASGVGTWQSPQGGGCQVGLTDCSGTCRNLQADDNNCGACGTVCPPGMRCINGSCQPSCGPGQLICSGACRDLLSDDNNCGSCGTQCPAGTRCVNGTCVVSCPTGQTACSGTCSSTQTDDNNCGSCGTQCPAGTRCVNGTCVVSCPTGQTACSGTCVNTLTNDNNCGSCGTQCPAGTRCVNGICQLSCQSGLLNCGGTCRDLHSDNTNCGACGNVCPSGTKCVNGVCQPCP